MHAHKLVHELERERECLVPPATRTKPEYKIMRSHVVVLPASTCAMMPMFRTVATARKENVRHAVASSVGHTSGAIYRMAYACASNRRRSRHIVAREMAATQATAVAQRHCLSLAL